MANHFSGPSLNPQQHSLAFAELRHFAGMKYKICGVNGDWSIILVSRMYQVGQVRRS